MEKNLDKYIRRLIELDSSAVEFKAAKDAELMELTTRSRNELGKLESALEEADFMGKQKHDEIIENAKKQAKEIDEAAKLKISELQASFSSFKEDAARDIWKQLIDIER